jgi:dimethylamine/trimethylamine dehydrogenase
MVDMVQSTKNGGLHELPVLRIAHWFCCCAWGCVDRSNGVRIWVMPRFASRRSKAALRERKIEERASHWAQEIEIADGAARVEIYDLYRDGSARTTEPAKGRLPRREGSETETLVCDTVLLCTARRSRNELYRQLSARQDERREQGIRGIYRAGDGLAPRYLADAIFDGHRLAQEFESPDPQRPKAIIRERQIWGHTVYPKLGDSVI